MSIGFLTTPTDLTNRSAHDEICKKKTDVAAKALKQDEPPKETDNASNEGEDPWYSTTDQLTLFKVLAEWMEEARKQPDPLPRSEDDITPEEEEEEEDKGEAPPLPEIDPWGPARGLNVDEVDTSPIPDMKKEPANECHIPTLTIGDGEELKQGEADLAYPTDLRDADPKVKQTFAEDHEKKARQDRLDVAEALVLLRNKPSCEKAPERVRPAVESPSDPWDIQDYFYTRPETWETERVPQTPPPSPRRKLTRTRHKDLHPYFCSRLYCPYHDTAGPSRRNNCAGKTDKRTDDEEPDAHSSEWRSCGPSATYERCKTKKEDE